MSILVKVDSVVTKINTLLKEKGVKAVCVKGGSIAKETFIKDDYDADLFVRFDYLEYKSKRLSDILETVLDSNFKFERVHGSRDYFQIEDGIIFEIVPVLKIKDYKQAVNVTDMSPLHVDYIKKKLKAGQADDIRLAKQFCKAAKVYGAESYIKGFSGHILDLLIINYGSFEKLINAAINWKEKEIFDIEKHLKKPLEELDDAKIHSPLIIVDPVQPDRNAAAALNKKQCDKFKFACKKFIDKPSKSSFKIVALKKTDLKISDDEELFFIEAKPLQGKKDVVGSKIMKAYEHLKRQIKRNQFEIMNTDWEFKKVGQLYFVLKKETLSEIQIIRGPPINTKEGCTNFKKKHKQTYVEDGRLFAKEKRKYRHAKDLVKEILKDKYVIERVNSIKLI